MLRRSLLGGLALPALAAYPALANRSVLPDNVVPEPPLLWVRTDTFDWDAMSGGGAASWMHAEVGNSERYGIHHHRKTLAITVDAVSGRGIVCNWSMDSGEAGFSLVTQGQPARFGDENPDSDFMWRVMIYMDQDVSMIQRMPLLRRTRG